MPPYNIIDFWLQKSKDFFLQLKNKALHFFSRKKSENMKRKERTVA
jgi:hypothetical protein